MSAPSVLVIGSSNVDFVMRLPHLPAPGETVTDGVFVRAFGGKGANQAVAAARAGGRVSFVTCLGNDPFAPLMKESFRADGIELTHAVDDPQQPTGTALIMLDQQARNCIGVAPGANNTLTPAHLDALEPVLARADLIVMQMELSPAATRHALELAARLGRRVVFNYAPTRGVPIPVGPAMSVLVVNENEASELLGWPAVTPQNAPAAAAALRCAGAPAVVVTLGAAGLVAEHAGGTLLLPAFPVQAVDTTAAGDTFCGALAVALGEDQPFAQALRFASAAAALCVTRLGAQPSIPNREAIEALLAKQ